MPGRILALMLVFVWTGIFPRQTAGQPASVEAALTLIREWQVNNPTFHARIDVAGQFVQQVAHYYSYALEGGGRAWKLDNHLIKPNEAHMILEETPADIIAYFPETEDHILTKILPQDVDLIAPGFQGMTDVQAVIEATKSSNLTTTDGVNELTLVFDPKKLGVNPPTANITIIARFDNSGRISQIEQRRLGLAQIATITYLTFNLNEVKAALPVTPDPAAADDSKTYEEAIQESIIFFAKEKQIQRNRL